MRDLVVTVRKKKKRKMDPIVVGNFLLNLLTGLLFLSSTPVSFSLWEPPEWNHLPRAAGTGRRDKCYFPLAKLLNAGFPERISGDFSLSPSLFFFSLLHTTRADFWIFLCTKTVGNCLHQRTTVCNDIMKIICCYEWHHPPPQKKKNVFPWGSY